MLYFLCFLYNWKLGENIFVYLKKKYFCTISVPIALVENESISEEPLPLDGRCKRSPTLRKVRKPDHGEDYLHSYKFKNSIERRFSRSQDNEVRIFVQICIYFNANYRY